jgi:transposase
MEENVNNPGIAVHNLDHLGIVAGIVDQLGIVEYINDKLGIHPNEKVSAGIVVKAMILNGLGFVSSPLYMFEKFFVGIPTEHLLGEGVKPEYLNDDRLGQVMDDVDEVGTSEVFLGISLQGVKIFQVEMKTSHLDSTSFHLHGEYAQEASLETEAEETKAIEITYGYSRDHRPDLKQFMMNLICVGDGDIPVFLEMASGNQSDKNKFAEILTGFKKQWNFDGLCVADAALYSADNLQVMTGMKWLTRVPLTLKESKEAIESNMDFKESKSKGYRTAELASQYGGIDQRWFVIESAERKKSDLKRIEKQLKDTRSKSEQRLKKFEGEEFACEADALTAATKLSNELILHELSEVRVVEKQHYEHPGKPSPKNPPIRTSYQVVASIVTDEKKIDVQKQRAGRFVLATNVLEPQELSADDALKEYKAQQGTERGFRFLKDPLFFASSVFLKTPKRIAVLGMIMALCLLVYNLAQRQLRKALGEQGETIPNQLGKQTVNPTLRWVFQCFMAVHLVTIEGVKQIINFTDERRHILKFFSPACQSYYLLLEPDP